MTLMTQHDTQDVTGLPIITDFYSPSCGPCKMIAPAVKALAKEFAGKAVFLKVNSNVNMQTSTYLGITALPTFVFALNGKQVHKFSGADARQLRAVTEQAIAMAQQQGTPTEEGLPTAESLAQSIKGAKVTEEAEPMNMEEAMEKAKEMLASYEGKPAMLMRDVAEKFKASLANAKWSVTVKNGDETTTYGNAEKKDADGGDGGNGADTAAAGGASVGSDSGGNDAEDVFMYKPDYQAKYGGSVEKVVIVGGGPAGLSAAIYAARAGMSPIIIAPRSGGQLLGKGVDVENYPGILGDLATGPGVVQLMREQAAMFDTRMLDDMLVKVDLNKRPFKLTVNGNTIDGRPNEPYTIETQALILATGATSRWLGIAGESEFRGRGVTSCATCDGFLYRNKDVVVIGGGDTAMEDALVLARTSSSVTIIHRRDSFRASKILVARVEENPKIAIKWNAVAERFEGGADPEPLTHVVVKDTKTGEISNINAAAAFIAIGHDPATSVFKNQLDMDEDGYVVVKHPTTHASVAGVFAAGDVSDKMYRQAVTSAGTGAMAALDAERWVSSGMEE